ncbi:MAG: cytochrome c peroxidase [Bacteroidota bacterium]|nr:cytochrome c peroxidase [Bacteroidota bacterium]MDP3144180.1 cytochrome c peroxidase [Bacteroidota bacterium]
MKKSGFILFSLILVAFAVVLYSCKKESYSFGQNPEDEYSEPVLPSQTHDYAKKHGVNSDLATLGRVLFFDKKLSGNKTTSCGSCHKQEFAFADNVKFNRGADGHELTRNSPSIQGLKGFKVDVIDSINGSFPNRTNQEEILLFWDGRQRSMADMVLNPVVNHKEMNMPDFATLIQTLKATNYYVDLFNKAYGNNEITQEKIAFALQGFLACLNTKAENSPSTSSAQSQSNQDAHLTAFEKTGKKLFHEKYNCATCHDPLAPVATTVFVPNGGYQGGSTPVVTMPSGEKITFMFNIGLDATPKDQGLGAITNIGGDKGVFKVPTLQNIAVTAPYMHDGRFATLESVVEHYSHGINDTRTLAPMFRNLNGSVKNLNISTIERDAIVAFLKTLKNDDFLTSPMYSNPFKKS